MKFQSMLGQDMLKLKVRKGFTLVEIMCSISIFSMLFLTATVIELNSIVLKRYSYDLNKYVSIMEEIKNLTIYNTNYSDIASLCNNNVNIFYIDKSKIDINTLKSLSLAQIMTTGVQINEPYIEVTITKNDVLELHIKMNTKILNKEQIFECDFYKGNY